MAQINAEFNYLRLSAGSAGLIVELNYSIGIKALSMYLNS